MSSVAQQKTISNECPLVTFALFSYNQERYICAALEGAFSQNYSPLEIILSDDFSSDRTFEFMKQKAKEYNGPHKIILNQNHQNIGVCAHINKVFGLANGELIIIAAGDDISLPSRTQSITKVWKTSGATAIYCESHVINNKGNKVGYWNLPKDKDSLTKLDCNNKFDAVSFYGAGAAYSAEIFKKFGELPQDIRNEDYNLAMRAALMKGIHYVNEPLLCYRKHADNLSFWVKQSKTKNPLIKASLMAQSLENLAINQRHIIEYIKHSCGNNSPLSTEFQGHMISTSVRCRLLYGISGKFKGPVITSTTFSRLVYVLIMIKELFVIPIVFIKYILRVK